MVQPPSHSAGKPFRPAGAARGRALLALLLVLAAAAALWASHAATLQCRQPADGLQAVAGTGGSSADGAATTTAGGGLASSGGEGGHLLLVPDQQQLAQHARVARPPSNDVMADSGTLGLKAARAAAAADARVPPATPGLIPKLFHRIYIADPNDEKRRDFTLPIAHQRWIEGCQAHHSARAGWNYHYWDYTAAEALISNHYPWFLPFYLNNASRAIEKSDLVRYAILHRLGGLYLDSDIECWRESYDMLEGFDYVGQATHGGEGATNAAIAARPGLEVFLKALELVQTRDIDTSSEANAIKVIARTGPDLLTAALEAVGLKRTDGMFDKQYELNGDVYRLWRVGAWFQPCQWWEVACRKGIYEELARGQVNTWHLTGFHRMVGSWIPGKEDGIGILNVTAEICGTADHVRGNGLPGGWVAPKPKIGRRRRLEEQHLPADGHDT